MRLDRYFANNPYINPSRDPPIFPLSFEPRLMIPALWLGVWGFSRVILRVTKDIHINIYIYVYIYLFV